LPSWSCRSSALRPFSSWESSPIGSSGEWELATGHRPRLRPPSRPARPPAGSRRVAPRSSASRRRARSTSCGAFHAGLDQEVVAFAFDGPAEWADQVYTGGESLYLRPSGGGAIAFFLNGHDTVDAWLADITGTEAFEVSVPQPVTVGGADGFVVDVRLADGAADAPALIESSDVPWNLTEGNAARVWIIDAEPEALAIVTGAPEADFEAWADAVSEAVDSLQWTSP
jgi:hypothetical protein